MQGAQTHVDPNTPVIVGVAQLSKRDDDPEPIEMMATVAEHALADSTSASLRNRIASVRVIKGIWPYRDPGELVSERLGLRGMSTAITRLGGNGVYDLFNETAASIQAGNLDAVIICSAETMRSRRRAKAAGKRSLYVDEQSDSEPDLTVGTDRDLADRIDYDAEMHLPVNFYAMVESAIRHRNGESIEAHRRRIAALWASASDVAATNPDAWIRAAFTADEIATPGPRNRMVAAPYPKLMTSNIDVDQAAAVVMSSVASAEAAGVPRDRWVFPYSGSGAYDHWITRTRWALDESPALHAAGQRATELAGLTMDDFDLLDLYSCFPSSVQLAQRELGIDECRPFTLTGGLTFAGGPYNSYCMHALARSVELLREGSGSLALLNGNGGFFTKHSLTIVAGRPAATPFRYERPQSDVDAGPVRPETANPPTEGELEAYTVTYDSEQRPARAILSVVDDDGARTWAKALDDPSIASLLATDRIGARVAIQNSETTPIARIEE